MGIEYKYYTEAMDTENRPERFLKAFGAILKYSNYSLVLDTYARTTSKCGRCSVTCQVYEESRKAEHNPCHRSELLLRIYRRYFTVAGSLQARLFNSFNLTDEYIDQMADALYECTACRRCQKSCPMGVDHGMITHLGRWVLAEIGIIPKALVVSVREQIEGETHNTSAIPLPALTDTCEFLEEEFEEIHGRKIKFPLDQEGAEMVFFPAVSDYLLEPDTLMGVSAVLNAAGVSWTIGTQYYDGINYGLFYSDRVWDRISKMLVDEVHRLKGQTILIGECGHASRSAKVGVPNFHGTDAPPVINILELTHKLYKEGRIKLKPNVIKEKVTYHDPCNLARSGWVVEQPRELLKHIACDYVEMKHPGEFNICCGGGGGTVSLDEKREFRTNEAGAVKARQLKETGAKFVVAPCANCKKQLSELIEDHELDMEVIGLHDLLLKSIDVTGLPEGEPKDDEEEE